MPKGKRRAGTSGGHDCSRKKTRNVAKAKRPGPAPAAPKEVMPSAANARAAGLEKAKIAKKNDDMLGMAEGLLSITKNPHGRSYTLVENKWGWEATIIANTSENRGKGSEEYIDDGRLLSSEVVKAIDSFVDKCHQNGKEGGGTVSARSIGLMLDEKFPDAPVTERAILYALTNFCNEGLGLKWGKVKNRKCQSDPGRLQVKQTYLRDFAAALKKEESGDYVLVYIDGNISTLSIVGC